MNDSCHFYRELTALESFQEAIQTQLHSSLPLDWWVVVVDIAGSTLAIERGDYKKVNTVDVACIAAVVNIDRSIQIPYVFGGDGATMAIPGAIIERAHSALRGAQRLSKEDFGLDLRIGLVRVVDLVSNGFRVNLAKVALSKHVTQTCLSGRGWDEAERRTKTPGSTGCVWLSESVSASAQANFEGFECRWHSVENFNGHKLSLLVTAMSGEADRNLQTYQDVLKKVYSIYGDVQRHHPLRASKMQLTMNPDSLSHELRVRSYSRNAWEKTRYFLMMMLKNLAGIYLLRGNLDTKAVRWSRYRNELVENTDFRKFDGMLRMVIDGNDQQFMELQSYLEGMFREKQLAYGMHQSGEALVTCLVHSYTGSHAFCGREQWRLRYGCTATQAADCQSKKRKTSKVDIGGVNATRGLLIHCPDRCRHPALPDPNAEPLTRQTPAPPRPATFRERQQVLLEFSIFTASDDT